MEETITLAAIGAVAFMALGGVWLGQRVKNYRDQLTLGRPTGRAFVVDVPLGTGMALLVIPRALTLSLAAGNGALRIVAR